MDSANFSGTGPGAICGVFPGAPTNCGTDFYCRSKSCPESIADGYDHCSAYAQQGAPCDGSSVPPCEQCEPGTSCVNGVCAASCANSQACSQACNGQFPKCIATGTNGGNLESNGNSNGSCYASCGSGLGAVCSAASPCCDLGNACAVPPSGVALPTGTCCETPDSFALSGIQCGSNGDCCAGYLCRQGAGVTAGGPSSCVTCDATDGTDCTADSQCCQASGYACRPPTTGPGQSTCQTCHQNGDYCVAKSDCCGSNVACGVTAAGGQKICQACQQAGGSCATDSSLCCSGTTCDASGVCVVSAGGTCTVSADCPPTTPQCLCPTGTPQKGICTTGGTALGQGCYSSDPRATCLCKDVTPAATCSRAATGDFCCLPALQTGCHVGTGTSCCNVGNTQVPCVGNSGSKGTCCLFKDTPDCILGSGDICCPGSTCQKTTVNGTPGPNRCL